MVPHAKLKMQLGEKKEILPASNGRKRGYSEALKQILKLFRTAQEFKSNNLESVRSFFGNYSENEINDFFKSNYGNFIFNWIIFHAETIEPLGLIIETVSPEVLNRKLNENFFKSFLSSEMVREKNHLEDAESSVRLLRIKKFKALLSINREGVTEWIEKHKKNEYLLSKKIMEDFCFSSKEFTKRKNICNR